MNRVAYLLIFAFLTSCSRHANQTSQPPQPPENAGSPAVPAQVEQSAPADTQNEPVVPPAPGTPGGLPDDRTPISEAPFTPTSAQGAGNLMQVYYALIAEGQYEKAWRLWTQSGEGSGMTAAAFAASFGAYSSYNANIGKPGEIEGAAGSLFVTVPVQIYARRRSGEEVHQLGEATLRRVNDVPGSTAEQREWHIFKIDLPP